MVQYFKAAHVPEEDHVDMDISSMYLLGDVKLWWRTRLHEVENVQKATKALEDQFISFSATWIVKEELRNLRQINTV